MNRFRARPIHTYTYMYACILPCMQLLPSFLLLVQFVTSQSIWILDVCVGDTKGSICNVDG